MIFSTNEFSNEALNSQEIDRGKTSLPLVTNTLGRGNFGIVVESGETAIKKPYSNDESRNQLKNEIEILLRISKYNHLNIVKLMEYSVESVHIKKIFNKTSYSIFYFLFS